MRRLGKGPILPILLGLALGTSLVAGCGGSAHAPGASAAPSTAAATGATTPAANAPAGATPGTEPEDLTFTGALSGHLSAGRPGDMYVCTGGNFVANPNTSGQLVVGPIVGEVGGKDVRMAITKIDYRGPGTYDAGGVTFDVGPDHYYPAHAPSGTLTVNPDGRSGTVAMDLAANGAPSATVGHAQGSWRCPPDAP